MAIVRLVFILLIVLTVIYVSVSLYSRAKRRDKLEQEWEDLGAHGDRSAFVREGLEEYDSSLRRKLILGVYIVPAVVIGMIVYFVNYT